MNWTVLVIGLALLGVLFWLKRAGQASAADVQKYLREGAMVIDVRSPGEYNSGHLTQAKNIPLDRIEDVLPGLVKDKNQVLLLHCQSGMRSGMAQKKLKALGYVNAFNLGSYARAESLSRNS